MPLAMISCTLLSALVVSVMIRVHVEAPPLLGTRDWGALREEMMGKGLFGERFEGDEHDAHGFAGHPVLGAGR